MKTTCITSTQLTAAKGSHIRTKYLPLFYCQTLTERLETLLITTAYSKHSFGVLTHPTPLLNTNHGHVTFATLKMRYLNTSLRRNTRPRSKHPQSFNKTPSSTQKGVLKHSLFTVYSVQSHVC